MVVEGGATVFTEDVLFASLHERLGQRRLSWDHRDSLICWPELSSGISVGIFSCRTWPRHWRLRRHDASSVGKLYIAAALAVAC